MTALKQKEILASLKSKDPKIVNQALQDIMKRGNATLLPELISIFHTTKKEQLRQGIKSILFQLKDQKSMPYLIDALKNDTLVKSHQIIAEAVWESGLDASEHLVFLSELALKSDYLTCLEILTIIENIEEGLTESDVTEAISLLTEQLQWKKTENDKLLASIVDVLQKTMIE